MRELSRKVDKTPRMKQTDKSTRALLAMPKPRGKVPLVKKSDLKRHFKLVVVGGKLVMREVK
ncbi:hypothetical protein [Candidatus Spongiihabitans sp.]|uniref:hypothetical protein n=1 Tax=Candidatus Spongiihabitans sp. TaxID=3101308 RepID=UPI003C7AAB0F